MPRYRSHLSVAPLNHGSIAYEIFKTHDRKDTSPRSNQAKKSTIQPCINPTNPIQ
ncbi:MAG: hypothetical protein HYY22_06715 [Thaumarchaeota archaeon]|nr:hypothetical protein [Nitrososphaerota archaeon]